MEREFSKLLHCRISNIITNSIWMKSLPIGLEISLNPHKNSKGILNTKKIISFSYENLTLFLPKKLKLKSKLKSY